jgi:XapX domain-containing protein
MVNYAIGVVLAFSIGAACRWFELPVPAPPKILGALLVVAMTVGYITADRFKAGNPNPSSTTQTTTSK